MKKEQNEINEMFIKNNADDYLCDLIDNQECKMVYVTPEEKEFQFKTLELLTNRFEQLGFEKSDFKIENHINNDLTKPQKDEFFIIKVINLEKWFRIIQDEYDNDKLHISNEYHNVTMIDGIITPLYHTFSSNQMFKDFVFFGVDLENDVKLTIGKHKKYDVKLLIGSIEDVFSFDVMNNDDLPLECQNEIYDGLIKLKKEYDDNNYTFSIPLIEYFKKLLIEHHHKTLIDEGFEDGLDEYFNRDVA